MGEQVPGGSIIDWYGDEPMPIEMASLIANAGEEHCQVVSLAVELLFEWRDSLIVQLGGHSTSVGIVEVQDGTGASWSQCKSRWC